MPKENDNYPDEKKWPPRPGNTVSWEEAEAWLRSFTPEQLSHTKVYVWRLWPVINRDPKFIDAIEGKDLATFDYKYLLDTHGGGKYKMMIDDLDGIEKSVTVKLDIPITESMPKLNYHELVIDHPNNKTYVERLKNERILTPDGQIMEDVQKNRELTGMQAIVDRLLGQLESARKRPDVDESALNRAIEMLGTAYSKAIDTTIGNKKSALEELTQVVEFAKSILATAQQPKQNDGEVWRELLKIQSEAHKTQLELMQRLVDAKTNPPGDDWIDRFTRIAEVFGIRIGGGGGRESTLETVLRLGAPIVQSVSNIIVASMAAKSGVPMPQQQTPQTTEVTPVTPEDQVKQVIRNYGGLVINALGNGIPGDEFAYNIINLFGIQVYNSIASYGKERILEAIKATPEFYQQVQHMMPTLEKFVDDFIDAPNRQVEEEEEEE